MKPISGEVCGALRYRAEEIRRQTTQPMKSAKRLRTVADQIETIEAVQARLATADEWMLDSSLDLLAVALDSLGPVIADGDEDLDGLLGLWAIGVEREAEREFLRGHTPD